jgi:hypothetical protein
VKRGNAIAGPYTAIGTVAATSDVDSAVANFRTYFYVVSAVNADGESPNSNPVSAQAIDACGSAGTQCQAASAACMQAAFCVGNGLTSGAMAVNLNPGRSIGLPLPPIPSSGNVQIEVGTVNIAGLPAMAEGVNTALILLNQTGVPVAANDNYGTDLRSYISYINATADVGVTLRYTVRVTCSNRSGCHGPVAYRISDLAHTTCGSPTFAPKGTVCRVATDECDAPDVCTGDSPDCPADAVYDDHHVCRPATDACDIDERCDGTSKACPGDRALPAGVVCRASAGGCDPAEVCDGTSKSCPADALATSGTVCRPALGPNDTDHVCSGSSATCPADATTFACFRPIPRPEEKQPK